MYGNFHMQIMSLMTNYLCKNNAHSDGDYYLQFKCLHLFIYIFIIIWSFSIIIIIKRRVPSIKLWTLPRSNKFTNNHHKTLYVCIIWYSNLLPRIIFHNPKSLVLKIIKLALCNYRKSFAFFSVFYFIKIATNDFF